MKKILIFLFVKIFILLLLLINISKQEDNFFKNGTAKITFNEENNNNILYSGVNFELNTNCKPLQGNSSVLIGGSLNQERYLKIRSIDCSSYKNCNASFWIRSGSFLENNCRGYSELSQENINRREINPKLIIYAITSSEVKTLLELNVTENSNKWKLYTVNLPLEKSVILKFSQKNHFGTTNDVWAIDEIIFSTDNSIINNDKYCPVYDKYSRTVYPTIDDKPTIDLDENYLYISIKNIRFWKYGAFGVTFQSYDGEKYIVDENRCLDSGIGYKYKDYLFLETTNRTVFPFTNNKWSVEFTGDCLYDANLKISLNDLKNCKHGNVSPIELIDTEAEIRVKGSFFMSYVIPPTIINPNKFGYSSNNFHFDIFYQKSVGAKGDKISCESTSKKIKGGSLLLNYNCIQKSNTSNFLSAGVWTKGTDPMFLISYLVTSTGKSKFIFSSLETKVGDSISFSGVSNFESHLCYNKECTDSSVNPVPVKFGYNVKEWTLSGAVNYIGKLWIGNNPHNWDKSDQKKTIPIHDQDVYFLIVSDAPPNYKIDCESITIGYYDNDFKNLKNQIVWKKDNTGSNLITKLSESEYSKPKDIINPTTCFKYIASKHARIGGKYIVNSKCVIRPNIQRRSNTSPNDLQLNYGGLVNVVYVSSTQNLYSKSKLQIMFLIVVLFLLFI